MASIRSRIGENMAENDKLIRNEAEAIECLKNNKPTSGYVMLQESIDMAIKALKKQIPKKPRKTDSYRGMLIRVYAYECPTCGNACLEKYMNERQNTTFCWNCGQKLDWSDAE
jgi:hypothetical protein